MQAPSQLVPNNSLHDGIMNFSASALSFIVFDVLRPPFSSKRRICMRSPTK